MSTLSNLGLLSQIWFRQKCQWMPMETPNIKLLHRKPTPWAAHIKFLNLQPFWRTQWTNLTQRSLGLLWEWAQIKHQLKKLSLAQALQLASHLPSISLRTLNKLLKLKLDLAQSLKKLKLQHSTPHHHSWKKLTLKSRSPLSTMSLMISLI